MSRNHMYMHSVPATLTKQNQSLSMGVYEALNMTKQAQELIQPLTLIYTSFTFPGKPVFTLSSPSPDTCFELDPNLHLAIIWITPMTGQSNNSESGIKEPLGYVWLSMIS